MARKPTEPTDSAANDTSVSMSESSQEPEITHYSREIQTMTHTPMITAPAFDVWLERQIKTLFAACDDEPDQALVELIRREFAKRDGKVTE